MWSSQQEKVYRQKREVAGTNPHCIYYSNTQNRNFQLPNPLQGFIFYSIAYRLRWRRKRKPWFPWKKKKKMRNSSKKMDKTTKKIWMNRQLTTRGLTRYPKLYSKYLFTAQLYFRSFVALDGNLGSLDVALFFASYKCFGDFFKNLLCSVVIPWSRYLNA